MKRYFHYGLVRLDILSTATVRYAVMTRDNDRCDG